MSLETREAAPRCPLCSGTGTHWHVRPYEAGYSRKCPRCGGVGRVEAATALTGQKTGVSDDGGG